MNAMPIDTMFRDEEKNINLMLFTEIDNFIEVYNNSVIELVQCFGTSFFGRIDHLASSMVKFRPKNSVPKHCIRSITYKYRGAPIERVKHHMYLGLRMHLSVVFDCHRKNLVEEHKRHIMVPSLNVGTHIKLNLKIFDGVIQPILIYCSEIWGMLRNEKQEGFRVIRGGIPRY